MYCTVRDIIERGKNRKEKETVKSRRFKKKLVSGNFCLSVGSEPFSLLHMAHTSWAKYRLKCAHRNCQHDKRLLSMRSATNTTNFLAIGVKVDWRSELVSKFGCTVGTWCVPPTIAPSPYYSTVHRQPRLDYSCLYGLLGWQVRVCSCCWQISDKYYGWGRRIEATNFKIEDLDIKRRATAIRIRFRLFEFSRVLCLTLKGQHQNKRNQFVLSFCKVKLF